MPTVGQPTAMSPTATAKGCQRNHRLYTKAVTFPAQQKVSISNLCSIHHFDIQGDGLASQSFHTDLQTTSQTKNLDVVVRQTVTIFQLLACEDASTMLTIMVLIMACLNADRVGRFDVKSDGLAGQSCS